MKKIIVNENWDDEIIEDNSNYFAVIVEDYSNNLHYVFAYGFDENQIRLEFKTLVNAFKESEQDSFNISFVKLPNTSQVRQLLEIGHENSVNSDEAVANLLARVDCELLDEFSNRLQEAKKRKKQKGSLSPFSSMTLTTGDPVLNMKHFNKMMGTDFECNKCNKPAEAAAETANVEVAGGESPAGASEGAGEMSGASEGGSMTEELKLEKLIENMINEADFYAHVDEKQLALPAEIELVPQKQVEDFIKQLSPEEEFEVGYITPIHLYSDIEQYFSILKATTFRGYTGIDYRDVRANKDTVADYDQRLAKAAKEIEDNPNGAKGHILNMTGFTTDYRMTNKLALNPHKSNEVILNGQKMDLSKLLFYPAQDSKPESVYFFGFRNQSKDNFTYSKMSRSDIPQEVTNRLKEIIMARSTAFSQEDINFIKKKLNMTVDQFMDAYPGVSVANYKMAQKFGMSPEEYVKKYPFSRRWSMEDLLNKLERSKSSVQVSTDVLNNMSNTTITKGQGYDRNINNTYIKADKPEVRALYTNQIFYISGRPGTLGHKVLKEGLTETKDLTSVNGTYSKLLADNISKINTAFENGLSLAEMQRLVLKIIDKAADTNAKRNFILSVGKARNPMDLTSLCTNAVLRANTDTRLVGDRWAREEVELDEAKRYVKRYYIRPQNVFASNKEEILKALAEAGDQNCSVYSLKNLADHDDVHLLKPSDIIYYYDEHVLYDKNHVQVMDYDLFVKHEEERKKFADVDAISDAQFDKEYDDRLTEAEVDNPFDQHFDDVNAYGEKLREGHDRHFTCCICGEDCEGYGNNPDPVRHEGECCDACNKKFVIPARLELMGFNFED